MRHSEPIVAVATPAGTGGVAVVRLCGEGTLAIALECLTAKQLHPRRATLTRIVDGDRLLDEAVATLYPAPHSYTGEETVELACHGSLYVQEAVLQLLIGHGARLAEPGEFTRRAFMNGKLNLSQAEAVADLIDAATPAQHRLAVSQLRGGYARQLADLRHRLVELTALFELELDFSQEDVEFADRSELNALVATLRQRVGELTASFKTGQALKRGIGVAIVGRPNAGKSSLLNALLADERAIVSPVAGTTRDTIEELLTINGLTFRFIDTAGLRQSDDAVESIGIERAYRAASQAEVVVYVHDCQQPASEMADDLRQLRERVPLEDKQLIVVHNKCDLAQPASPQGLLLSASHNTGIEELKQQLHATFASRTAAGSDLLVSNARHYAALLRVDEALGHVADGLAAAMSSDLVATDLRDALYHLGTITGEVTGDEVLSTIFSRFCIGK